MRDRQYSGEIERLRAPERQSRMEVERVVELTLEGITARSVLDIGTGSGLFAESFARQGLRIAGIDLREDMLKAAREYVPGGNFRQAHMEALPYENDSFAIVFMGHVLHEADNILTALQEAYRVSQVRVSVLEWPYIEEDAGPPLKHRISEQILSTAATKAGYANLQKIELEHMVLYRLDKRNLNPWCI